jgi:hypothetical protein
MVLTGIFDAKKVEMTGGWGTVHNEDLHNLYSLSGLTGMIKTRKSRRVKCS